MGGGLSTPRRGRFTGTQCIGGWAPEPVWTGAENLAPTGILSPDRPVSSESLYRLSYPDPTTTFVRNTTSQVTFKMPPESQEGFPGMLFRITSA